MNRTSGLIFLACLWSSIAQAKVFQNSYVAFEVPDTWVCVQEGVAWTCNPKGTLEAKEAVIVLAAKVAGPEDNLGTFLSFLKQPKKITTKVGTPMPSQVMYAQQRQLAGHNWVQAQHLGSEIQEYYTLYLATVKDHLAILISFSAEQNRYKTYNPVFDKAIKTLRIVANQQLLFPKTQQTNSSDVIGIQVSNNPTPVENMLPPPARKSGGNKLLLIVLGVGLVFMGAVYILTTRRKKNSTPRKIHRIKTK